MPGACATPPFFFGRAMPAPGRRGNPFSLGSCEQINSTHIASFSFFYFFYFYFVSFHFVSFGFLSASIACLQVNEQIDSDLLPNSCTQETHCFAGWSGALWPKSVLPKMHENSCRESEFHLEAEESEGGHCKIQHQIERCGGSGGIRRCAVAVW